MVAKIAVEAASFAIDKPYSYKIPVGMELRPGCRVRVSFGKGNRATEGVVLSIEDGSETGLKEVEEPLDKEPLLTECQLRLAAFLRERYFCTFCDAVRAILPTGVWFRVQSIVSLTDDRSWEEKKLRKSGAEAILHRLAECGGSTDVQGLRRVMQDEDALSDVLSYLTRKKWICGKKRYTRRSTDKTEKVAALAVPPDEAMQFANSRGRNAAMQKNVLQFLCGIGNAAVKDIQYYTGATMITVKRLEKLGLLSLSSRPIFRCSEIKPVKPDGPLCLNEEQQTCFIGLRQQMEQSNPGTALLYGVTGSGKTSVYIKLIQACLEQGRSAVLLVPEIALTPQLLSLLAAWFQNLVAVLHSSLSTGERYDQWNRVRRGEARVVVGTRSAVFAPCVNLGLIILDEEQEHSYKSEMTPRYHAREVALWRGFKEGALVLLGSATPSVETMYRAKNGDYRLYVLHRRFNGRPLPKVQIVDMGQELRQGNDTSVSYDLREALLTVKNENKQAILLLNRRGNSRALVCVDCGAAPECPRCSLRMTYHSANRRLMCHYCGFSQTVPDRCPCCGGPLKPVGIGTQKVQQELAELFPDMRVRRMDADTISAVNTHEKVLDAFQSGEDTVLVGTQMVAKGLNLPRVTLVGVLDADMSLYTGGYRSGETTFDLITQVVGRAGRGDSPGKAILQTFSPKHTILRMAAEQDYDSFYELELRLRRVQNAPPFADFVLVTFQGEEEAQVLRCAVKFRDGLLSCLKKPDYSGETVRCLGPAPCPIPKINYHFRYRLTVNCCMNRKLRLLLAYLLRQFSADKAGKGVTATADVNGFE